MGNNFRMVLYAYNLSSVVENSPSCIVAVDALCLSAVGHLSTFDNIHRRTLLY